jgi:predicted DCC family thiol-disulfide oxidoreductase YuxK
VPGSRAGPALVIYDGDCGLCRAAAAWALARAPGSLEAAAWQDLGSAGLARLGLALGDVRRAAYLVLPDGRLLRGHLAMAGALRAARWPWPLVGCAIELPGVRALAALTYAAVARWRHRLPLRGGRACGARGSVSPPPGPNGRSGRRRTGGLRRAG